jgi:hypothetical protein
LSHEYSLLGVLFGIGMALAAPAGNLDTPGEAFLKFLGSLEQEDDWAEFFDSVPQPVGKTPGMADESDSGEPVSENH